jgi:hypothetical protein
MMGTVQVLAAATVMAEEEVGETHRKMSQAQQVNDEAFHEGSDLAEKTQMQADVVTAMTDSFSVGEA